MLNQKILDRIKRSATLPKLPQVMLKLINACDNDDIKTSELTEIISSDPSLTSRLLEILGSAYINLRQEIKSIESAVVYLGINTIKNIAISTSVTQVFNETETIPGFNMNEFWRHSFTCGVISKKIASKSGQAKPDEAYIGGLLHEIGRLILMINFPSEYALILKHAETSDNIHASENKKFKLNSNEVGAWISREWNLNPLISDAILYINEPLNRISDALPLVKIIYIANRLSTPLETEPPLDTLNLIGIEKPEVEAIINETKEEVSGMAEALGITLPAENNHNDIQVTSEIHKESLKTRVKDASLLFGTLQNLLSAKTQESIMEEAESGLKITLGIKCVFFFLYDEKNGLLIGHSTTKNRCQKIIKSIAIPLTNRKSLLTRCLLNGKTVNSITPPDTGIPAISDEQIIRLLETEGMYCLPLISADVQIGIMVLGVSNRDIQNLIKKSTLTDLFAKQTALCLANTGLRNNQDLKLQDERLLAYSTITQKIVHEINNPMGIITNYLRMLSLKLPDKHPAQTELIVISEEIDRISILIDQLSVFSQPDIREFSQVDINQLYTSILEIIKKSILQPKGIESKINIDPKIPLIETDKNGLKQILINLLKNAAEAMRQNGKVSITTRLIPQSEKLLIDEKRKIPGSVEVVITDNGPGIPDHIKEKLFEPYNSSKHGSNSGLGLSIVHNIIKKLNGSISCESILNEGTVFKILLPVSSKIS